MRWIAGLLLLVLITAAGLYVAAGRAEPPQLTITQPARAIGQNGVADITATAPDANFSALTISVEQNGRRFPLFSLDSSQAAGAAAGEVVTQIDRDSLRISQPFGKQTLPELQSGPARLIVEATRPSLLNLRMVSSTATSDFQIRLEPPRVAVLSTKHYVNHGGSEAVIYRATPSDVASGVRVGTIEYPGFPLGGADGEMRIAFFALLHDQDLTTPIAAFARDETGAEAKATFVDDVFPKPFKRSRLELDDRFLGRIVPEIIENSPELKMTAPTEPSGLITAYLTLNGELRRKNAGQIAAFASKTSATRLWQGPFTQLGNSAVEAAFADRRTYIYNGKEVDQQVHLGFDLAATARVPVAAANAGRVLSASWLGIYGNTVILDHGQGVQSLYGHLSSFDVKAGDDVTKGQTLGRSGLTGMAGGDHLHFTMLVGGQMVNPVEWWDPHWITDRIERKLTEASGSGATR